MSKTWKFMQRMEYLISPRNRNGVKTEIHLKYSPIKYSMLSLKKHNKQKGSDGKV